MKSTLCLIESCLLLALFVGSETRADQAFGMMRSAVKPNGNLQDGFPCVIDDNGFTVMQYYPEERGVLLSCGETSDDRAAVAFWNVVVGEEATRWIPPSEGAGNYCFIRDLKEQYVSGQTMDTGVFAYCGTKTLPVGTVGTITVRCFKPASDELARAVREALAKHREAEKKKEKEKSERWEQEKNLKRRIAYGEKEIRNELSELRKRWEEEDEAARDAELSEILDKERVTLRFPASARMPGMCGLKLGMSRGDVHDNVGEKMDMVVTTDSYLGRRENIFEERVEDILMMETRKLKKRFSIFDRVQLHYCDALEDVQLSVLKRFILIGYVDLDRYSFASCKEEFDRIRKLLEAKLKINFYGTTESQQYAYCSTSFGTYKNEYGDDLDVARIELRMERNGDSEKFMITVDGWEGMERIMGCVYKRAQKLIFEANDAKKESLRPKGEGV